MSLTDWRSNRATPPGRERTHHARTDGRTYHKAACCRTEQATLSATAPQAGRVGGLCSSIHSYIHSFTHSLTHSLIVRPNNNQLNESIYDSVYVNLDSSHSNKPRRSICLSALFAAVARQSSKQASSTDRPRVYARMKMMMVHGHGRSPFVGQYLSLIHI